MKLTFKFVSALFVSISMLICLIGCSDKPLNPTSTPQTAPLPTNSYTYGSTFKFSDFTITMGNSDEARLSVLLRNDSYYNGNLYFYIPVTITNNSNKPSKLNYYYVSFFCPDGSPEMQYKKEMGFKDDFSNMDNLEPGETKTVRMYVVYESNGDYIFSFKNTNENIVFKLAIDTNKMPKLPKSQTPQF